MDDSKRDECGLGRAEADNRVAGRETGSAGHRRRHGDLGSDASDADSLSRSAEWFERKGQPATATLFRNAAWIAEHGVEWLAYVKADGGTDDVEVVEYHADAIGGAAGHDDDNADADGRKR